MKALTKKSVLIVLIIFFVLSAVLISVWLGQRASVDLVSYTELGIPTSERYVTDTVARSPWDMVIWENRLYIGSGNYDTNAGPVDIWCYLIADGTWKNSGTLPEEEIDRFCIINDRLFAPGIDPQEDWTLGNHYTFDNGQWVKHRNINGGLHTFDIVEYDDMMFVGLGVLRGSYPVVCSEDGGRIFNNVTFFKNGVAVDTAKSENVRVYDLFVFKDELYAAFLYGDTEPTYDLYRYENGAFVYDNSWYGKIHQIKYTNNIISAKTDFKGSMFFTTGYLYATEDMTNFKHIVFPNSETVYDICCDDERIYALCGSKQEDGKYKITVYANKGQNVEDFKALFTFVYDIPPLSFAKQDDKFFIGMSETKSGNDKNGSIILIEYSK